MDGRAAYVCYHLHGLPGTQNLPTVPGLRNRRGEYGIEIILTVSFLHYWIGLSLDHVCSVIEFFTELSLAKSQANSLLNQLSQDWEQEYETISALLSHQMVIYIDETGWKVGKKACYTWAFSTVMRSERNVRKEAEVRKGGRTSKSESGAKRRGIIMTVLATLETRFEHFTLNHLVNEMECWTEVGFSKF